MITAGVLLNWQHSIYEHPAERHGLTHSWQLVAQYVDKTIDEQAEEDTHTHAGTQTEREGED